MWTEVDEQVLELLESIDVLDVAPDEKAQRLEDLAEEYPVGSEHRSAFLLAAGHQRLESGDVDAARRSFETVRSQGSGPDLWDATASLVDLALRTGADDEVASLTKELLAVSRERDLGSTYARVAAAYEEHDRLREAARWYSLANRDVDPDDLDRVDVTALHGRRRVRERLGLPADRYDEASAWLTRQPDTPS